MIRPLLSLLILLGLAGCSSTRLSEQQAIALAENFVLEQGYTDSRVQIDSAKIRADIMEQTISRKGVLALRYNSLKPKAAFYKKGLTKWTVGFQYTKDSTRFRIVQFSRRGRNIKMVHQDLKRSYR